MEEAVSWILVFLNSVPCRKGYGESQDRWNMPEDLQKHRIGVLEH